MTSPRIAILGPCHTAPFEQHLSLKDGNEPLPPGMGGYNITHLVLARLARGLATDVITCDPSVSSTVHFEGPLLRLWVVPRRSRRMMRDLYRRERKLLRQAISESAPNCVHANWTGEYALAAAGAGVPWVLTAHDNPAAFVRWIGASQVIAFLLSTWVVRRAPAVAGVSPYVCESIRRFGKRKAACIPNAIHLPLLEPIPDSTRATRNTARSLISILNRAAFKNARRGLQAFHGLRRECPEMKLQLVGPGLGPGGGAEQWARDEGISEGVVFHGIKPYSDCLELIRNADVLFHPALEESMGCQVAEAMALQTRVVCAQQAAGPVWLTENGRYGALVDGHDHEAMARGLVQTIREPFDSAGIAAAQKHILELTSADACLARCDELYAQGISRFS